jgi:hypothetical protein
MPHRYVIAIIGGSIGAIVFSVSVYALLFKSNLKSLYEKANFNFGLFLVLI